MADAPIDTAALRAKLAEYDPSTPRCHAPLSLPVDTAADDDDEQDDEARWFVQCCLPVGHEGSCAATRKILGWPGREVLSRLLDEVDELRTLVRSAFVEGYFVGSPAARKRSAFFSHMASLEWLASKSNKAVNKEAT